MEPIYFFICASTFPPSQRTPLGPGGCQEPSEQTPRETPSQISRAGRLHEDREESGPSGESNAHHREKSPAHHCHHHGAVL